MTRVKSPKSFFPSIITAVGFICQLSVGSCFFRMVHFRGVILILNPGPAKLGYAPFANSVDLDQLASEAK